MPMVRSISVSDFGYEVMFAPMPVVVDFYADWCGPCRMIGPILEQFAAQYEGRVKFVKVNVDSEQELASHYGISSIPTLLIFHQGELVERMNGISRPAVLKNKLDALVNSHVVTN